MHLMILLLQKFYKNFHKEHETCVKLSIELILPVSQTQTRKRLSVLENRRNYVNDEFILVNNALIIELGLGGEEGR